MIKHFSPPLRQRIHLPVCRNLPINYLEKHQLVKQSTNSEQIHLLWLSDLPGLECISILKAV
ncbi:hypothetical protein AArcMg_0697 [Natrarchaeobaculum sulfurireducens]|uniref:Uncharacterized protein n=1 Tax=Natrarchaeobaculum sulfurireducens TaxID=2044521 RepID=A0A346PMH4_9EURY|nr:hypothetical protein AArcMg_0697 [Natrarchaeobaculum sulfurireducens]